jgi:hypothetical protein
MRVRTIIYLGLQYKSVFQQNFLRKPIKTEVERKLQTHKTGHMDPDEKNFSEK